MTGRTRTKSTLTLTVQNRRQNPKLGQRLAPGQAEGPRQGRAWWRRTPSLYLCTLKPLHGWPWRYNDCLLGTDQGLQQACLFKGLLDSQHPEGKKRLPNLVFEQKENQKGGVMGGHNRPPAEKARIELHSTKAVSATGTKEQLY